MTSSLAGAITPALPRHRTKRELVYQTLRDAIMRCELAPGRRLLIDDLARQLEVSAIPVREA
ncbi:MAG TPA: GntR family transcriptional regulator, partial [Vicinamibacteria bacterium]|nr:GntR family transcriptional regulator [Vicinamibacteria bacterium]